MGWGRPKYGSSGPKGQTRRIKEGDNIYRFLPPMHSLAEEGKWANYVTVHFGYAGVDPQDSTKTKQKPFRCIEVKDFRSRMILETCPECVLYGQNAQALKDQEAELRAQCKAEEKTEKETEELLETALASLKGWLKAHGPDRKHYINAMTPDGKEFVQVAISHRTKKQLDVKFKELQEEEQLDPLDLEQGVLINIKRTGKFRDVQDVVVAVKEKVEVEVNGKKTKLEQIAVRPLTEEESERALKECRDLTTVGGFELTRAQIQALTECSGDPEEVDAIFKLNQPGSEASKGGKTESKSTPKTETKSTRSSESTSPKAASDNAKGGGNSANDHAKPAVDPRVAARLAEIQKKMDAKEEAEAKAKAEAQAAAAATSAKEEENPLEMDDEAFLAKFGGG